MAITGTAVDAGILGMKQPGTVTQTAVTALL